MTAVILINWNGADDTIACLASLEKASGDFCVVVADNGSTDDSVQRLVAYAATSPLRLEILPLGRNWGFAAGNNRAIAFARDRFAPDSYMLLNNDTEVTPDFMTKLQAVRAECPGLKVLGPLICYWSDKNRIWSCGGKLIFGSRKAYYRDADVSAATGSAPNSLMDVQFISGCALFADASLVDDDGHLLTERFFFGEEDYEFALRMRKAGEEMMIVCDSVIYHKVSSSARKFSTKGTLGRDYVYYLGRLIASRDYYGRLSFALICLLTGLSCVRYFHRDGLGWRQACALSLRLLRDAHRKEGIDYDDFKAIVLDGTYFEKSSHAAEQE